MIAWSVLLACTGEPDSKKDPPGPPAGGDDSTPAVDTVDSSPDDSAPDDSTADSGDSGSTGPVAALVFEGARPKNLLVISLDTARRDRIGFFDDVGLTPNLTGIFSSGVVLEDHRSCSNWTSPSTYCAQTGRFPLDEGFWHTELSAVHRDPLVTWPPPNPETIASLLGDAGYTTRLVTANSMFSTEINGPAAGFQEQVNLFWQNSPGVVDAAIASAGTLGEGPWYLHVHFIDPHSPYEAPDAFMPKDFECPWNVEDAFGMYQLMWSDWWGLTDEEKDRARTCLLDVYGAELHFWDSELARLWAALDDTGRLDDTLVVFWTDHGEQFAEHDNWQHGHTLHSEENRSTAAFWARNIEPLRWTGPTLHQDLAPTILEALGLAAGNHSGLVLGYAPADRARVVFNYLYGWDPPHAAVIQNDDVLLYSWDGQKHFYDLSVDPEEEIDLYDASNPEVKALWDVLAPVIATTEKNWPGLAPVDVGP